MRSGKTCSGPEKQAPKTYSNCSHCGPERHAAVRKSKHPKRTLIVDITVRKTCSGQEKQAPKTYSNCSHCGPERPAAVRKSKHQISKKYSNCRYRGPAVRKSKHPKRTLIVAIVVRKDLQRSGKASTQKVF